MKYCIHYFYLWFVFNSLNSCFFLLSVPMSFVNLHICFCPYLRKVVPEFCYVVPCLHWLISISFLFVSYLNVWTAFRFPLHWCIFGYSSFICSSQIFDLLGKPDLLVFFWYLLEQFCLEQLLSKAFVESSLINSILGFY